jgi:hypothetical protein
MRKFKFIAAGDVIAVVIAKDIQEALLLVKWITKENYVIVEHIKP